MNVPPARAVYVGDNAAKDFLAPNHLGMVSIQVCRARALHTAPASQPQGAARHRLERLDALPGLLGTLAAPAMEPVNAPSV